MGRRKKPPVLVQRDNGYWYAIEGNAKKSMETKDQAEAVARFSEWLAAKGEIESNKDIPVVSVILDLYYNQHTLKQVVDPGRDLDCKKNIDHYFGSMPITSVDSDTLEAYCDVRYAGELGRGRKAGPSTVRRELSYFSAACTYMVESVEPIHLRMPAHFVPAFKKVIPAQAKPKNRVILLDEMEEMLMRAQERVSGQRKDTRLSRLQRFLWTGFETGARATAIESLKWPQIDLRGRLIDFQPEGKAQTNKRNPIVPISDVLWPIIERAFAERMSPWFMDSDGSIRTAFENFMARWGYQDTTRHTLRHSYMTQKAMAGVAMLDIAALTGDDEATVRKNYIHLHPDHLRQAANARPDKITSQIPSQLNVGADRQTTLKH
ncbi:MAG: tyrosine-type recombinase/integrase [Arenicellales bacterium]|nr:tyrosine-type recombinase/integrase [Arenicellales bacterium]